MSTEDLERYEAEIEFALFREYKDIVGTYSHLVETERRFYLCNGVEVKTNTDSSRTFFELELTDAWVWDIYRSGPARFVAKVKVLTFKDINIEELGSKA